MKKFKWAWMALVVLVVILWGVPQVWSGTWSKKIIINHAQADSGHTKIYAHTGTSMTLLADSGYTSFPATDVYTLDSAISYGVETVIYDGADAYTYFEYTIPPLTSNAVVGSITYVDTIGVNLTEQGGIPGANRVLAFLVLNSADSSTITNVDIFVTDTVGNNKLGAFSHSGGTCSLIVADGIYSIRAQEGGYSFDAETITIAGDYTDTIWGESYDVGSSGLTGITRVYGLIYDVNYSPVPYATITATMADNAYNTCDTSIILNKIVTTKSSTTGLWILDLIHSACLSNDNSYDITIEYNGIIKSTSIQVEDGVNAQRVAF